MQAHILSLEKQVVNLCKESGFQSLLSVSADELRVNLRYLFNEVPGDLPVKFSDGEVLQLHRVILASAAKSISLWEATELDLTPFPAKGAHCLIQSVYAIIDDSEEELESLIEAAEINENFGFPFTERFLSMDYGDRYERLIKLLAGTKVAHFAERLREIVEWNEKIQGERNMWSNQYFIAPLEESYGKYPDFELSLEDGSKLQLHRAVLIGASTYFRGLFDFTSTINSSQLLELDSKLVAKLVKWIYTGELSWPGSIEGDRELLRTADRLGISLHAHWNNYILERDDLLFEEVATMLIANTPYERTYLTYLLVPNKPKLIERTSFDARQSLLALYNLVEHLSQYLLELHRCEQLPPCILPHESMQIYCRSLFETSAYATTILNQVSIKFINLWLNANPKARFTRLNYPCSTSHSLAVRFAGKMELQVGDTTMEYLPRTGKVIHNFDYEVRFNSFLPEPYEVLGLKPEEVSLMYSCGDKRMFLEGDLVVPEECYIPLLQEHFRRSLTRK